MSGDIAIRYTDPSQETEALQQVANEIKAILTPNEEIYYIALQGVMAIGQKKDAVVATSNRIILYRPTILGTAQFSDFQWQDVRDVRIKQGMFSAELTVETTDGQVESMGNLDREQTKRIYGVSQQLEQEWREKRRIREMEEARARSGGIYMSSPPSVAAPESAPADDPVAKLAKAKTMLDQGLISEAEYDALKAKILSTM